MMSPQSTGASLGWGWERAKAATLGTWWGAHPTAFACGQAWSPPEGPCGRVGYGERLGTLDMLGTVLACLSRMGQLDGTIPGK